MNVGFLVSDVSQAFVQTNHSLRKPMFIKRVVSELDLDCSIVLHLLCPPYHLNESGNVWLEALGEHHRKELDMKPLCSELAVYFLNGDKRLIGMSGTYMEDTLSIGPQHFHETEKSTSKWYEMVISEQSPCALSDFAIGRDENNILLHQKKYVSKLKILGKRASLCYFASVWMKMAYLPQTLRAGIYEISTPGQVTQKLLDRDRRLVIGQTNKPIKRACGNSIILSFEKLGITTVHVSVFSVASFARSSEYTSQIRYRVS